MGLITTLYTCLVVGIPVIYFVAYGPKGSIDGVLSTIITFPSFLQKHSLPASTKLLLFASPMFYRGIYQLIDQVSDLSFLGCMLAGGSSMGKEELEVLDAVFASKGCTVPVMNGYGQNEMAGAVTLNQIGRNRRGSAGTAVDGTDLMVVDLQDFKPLPRNAVGKILERSESLFIGYENMPERTEASFITDENGDSWFDTNDVGYLDDDGYLRKSADVIQDELLIYQNLDVSKCSRLAFAGIHVVAPRVIDEMAGWPDVFSIIDFYIKSCDRLVIKGMTYPGLRILDVGKPETLAAAPEMLRSLQQL